MIAYAGFFLNLFNLIPVSPLDGGRITAVLGPRIWLVGAPIMLGLLLWRPSPVLVMVAVLAIPQLWNAWKYDPGSADPDSYYSVSRQIKIEYSILYLALLAVLALITYSLHLDLERLHHHGS